MDVKTECDLVNICHGCLSTERYVNSISEELNELFCRLRNDDFQSQCPKLLLCWECIALLRKFKMFQARIKMAQSLLMQYLETYYIKDETLESLCLSSLKSIHQNTFNKELFGEKINLNREEKFPDNDIESKTSLSNQSYSFNKENTNENGDNKESLIDEDIILELKQECDGDIKEESYFSENGNDSDYLETELKVDDEKNHKKNNHESRRENILFNAKTFTEKKYAVYATVTENDDVSMKKYTHSTEMVQISMIDYENLLKRERSRYVNLKLSFKCNECGEKYLKKIDLVRHVNLCHNSESTFPRRCDGCQTTIISAEHLNHHWMSEHTFMWKCTLCEEVCRSASGMKRHVRRVHRKMYTCKKCSHQTWTLADFIKHYRSSHENLICEHCNMRCRKKKTMSNHMKYYHLPAFCELCNRSYINHKTLKSHNRMTHPELSKSDARKELSYCVECDKQYPTVYKYRRHLKDSVKHTPKKKIRVPCPDCGKIFTRTSFMKNHYNFVHLKMNKNCCDKCDKKYTTGYGLRKHIERVHKKIQPLKDKICDLCGRGFATNKILQNHRRTHTGERPYKCMHCPAAFVQKFAMQSHQKTQHKNTNVVMKS